MKVPVASVRRRLTPGTTYTGEFIGINRKLCRPGMEITRRVVRKNTTYEIASELLDGPKTGELVYLGWSGITADETDGSVTLANGEYDPPEEFLRITF